MKVCILCPPLGEEDGLGICALRMINALRDAGVSLSFISDIESDDSRPNRILPACKPRQPGFDRKIRKITEEARVIARDADLLHAFSESYAPLAMALANGRPYFVTLYGSYANPARDSDRKSVV